MKFTINRNSGVTILKQIEQGIEDKINSGFLKEGQKLPSIRKLSETLGVSFITIVKAYDNLESKKVIYKIHGKGCFVTCRTHTDTDGYIPNKWSDRINNYITRAQFHRHINERKDYKYDFGISSLSDYIHPEKLVADLVEDSKKVDMKLLSQYPPLQGDIRLRKTLSKLLAKEGIATDRGQLLIVNGVQQAINLVSRTLTGKGDVLCIEETSFPAAIDVFKWEGTTIKPIPLLDDGIDINYLHKLCDQKPPAAIYVIPNFNNPTGILMSDKKKKQLLELAQTYNFMIIEDDTWSDLYFTKTRPSSIKSLDSTGNVIYLRGFSKIIGAGYRIGVISAAEQIIKILTAAKSISDLGTPQITQLAVDGILNSVEYESKLINIRQSVLHKRDIVLKTIKNHGNDVLNYTEPKGGLCIWLTLPESVDTERLLLKARKKGVNFLPGHIFYADIHKKNHLRLSYNHLEDSVIEEGVKELLRVISYEF